ncbi:GNAT family N-acetyltransferase [Clostridium sp. 'deep sea']|uniref:GNAT family N-acetyltransferase n=1 Tax=Clostridium sp. 'deep sea' TaxID=2779445 RepID=UPI0018967DF5|nr:GNAT family N-acetyltransferase [Clostridium sp. 'deep sea']QOR35968.1 GNAT family N-acetyltransferase [Clostridium sp. 'deep sea']
MKINLQQVSKNKYVAKDVENNIIGEGYIIESMASKIYKQDRVNYFLKAKADNLCNKKEIVKQLIKLAEKHKAKNHPKLKARIYSCLLVEQKNEIEFYNSIEEFDSHEQMLVLNAELQEIKELIALPKGYSARVNSLNTDTEINSFIKQHAKVFTSLTYSLAKIKELQELEGFRNIAIYYKNVLVANILLNYEYEEDYKYGVIEDIFVLQEYRKQGLADYLISKCFSYFKNNSINEVRLEVWSENNRANNLYKKHGFNKFKITEVSIGFNL